jgi:hypothetical protein
VKVEWEKYLQRTPDISQWSEKQKQPPSLKLMGRIRRASFPNVTLATNTDHKTCDVCVELRSRKAAATSSDERKQLDREFSALKDWASGERRAEEAARHRTASDCDYIHLSADQTDDIWIPHFPYPNKPVSAVPI